MSNALMAKFNMKGAKGEKVVSPKKQFTQLLKVYMLLFSFYIALFRF